MSTILESFGDLGINISHQEIMEMEKLAIHFTLRKTHPLTFDGPYLGVNPIAFKDSDNNALFDLFDVSRQDVEKAIRRTPSINRNFIVQSDPFNLLSLWITHLAPIYIKDPKVCYQFMMNVLRYFHYKIFCSVVNRSFKHGTNQGIMTATVASLTKKSDIIQYESWRRLIDAHCEKMLDPQGRFYHTIVSASPDEAFLNVIAENQTALRAKIVTFAQSYYEAHVQGDEIKSKSSIAENKDGERIIAQSASVIDSASAAMVAEILSPNMFINDVSIDDIARSLSSISSRMLKTALFKINETAVLQTSTKSFDKVKVTKDEIIYIGIRALIIQIIRSMIRICRTKRVNMGNRAAVFQTMSDAYRSSRNLDADVVAVKKSVALLVDPWNITVNSASQATLRLAVIYYIVYRMIIKMK